MFSIGLKIYTTECVCFVNSLYIFLLTRIFSTHIICTNRKEKSHLLNKFTYIKFSAVESLYTQIFKYNDRIEEEFVHK